MAHVDSAVPAMLESSSFPASPDMRQSKHLRDDPYTTPPTDETNTGLPPTPPTVAQHGEAGHDAEPPPPPHADGLVNALMSKKSSLSTPVNARSPPTPDPSPPRTSSSHANATPEPPERPPMFAYPSSRADSFRTAREDPFSSDVDDSRSVTSAGDRLSTVEEDRGLGLAFEHDDNDVTPTNRPGPYFPPVLDHPGPDPDTTAGADEHKRSSPVADVPDREWNTDLMRNVTIRRKRRPQSSSPRKNADAPVVEPASPTPSVRARRASSLRERVEASHNSPVTPSIEKFAQSIGWPSEASGMHDERSRDASNKRLSTSSVGSTVVSAMVIVTPPRRTQTLRHSGRNMAYRRDVSSPSQLGSQTPSSRTSMHSYHDDVVHDVPLHRLVHKRTNIADRRKRASAESDTLGSERIMSPSLSLRQRTIDSSAHTLAHQESIRNVLQPAADILSRSSSLARSGAAGSSYHKRVNSAPEAARRATLSPKPRNFSELSPSGSPRRAENIFPHAPVRERAPSPTLSPKPHRASPTSRKVRRQPQPVSANAKRQADLQKSLPRLPDQGVDGPAERDVFMGASHPVEAGHVPSALMDRVRRLIADRETAEEATLLPASNPNPATAENLDKFSPLLDSSPPMRWSSRSSRARSGERRWSSPCQDNASLSPDMAIRPSLDGRVSTEEMVRRSHERRRSSGEHGRVSFDASASRREEHAMARHLYSQSTPFSQFSDTVEVTEATAVSIFPHNNNSLLVVQQMARTNSMMPEQRQLTGGAHLLMPQDYRDLHTTPTPPFVDASESHQEYHQGKNEPLPQPTLNFQPSTPPKQIALPQPSAVDSPLKNPRVPPEPPKINFIPPTPMEELEKQLAPAPAPPGPPERSDSHPQRRLSVLQRARRYSDNLITPLLARASNNRGRHASDSHRHTHRNPRVPTVNDADGTLHPFWRPRGFWDGFEDSESESDEEEALPQGGDTSDVEDPSPPNPPKRSITLSNKLKGGFRGSGGFLIGNSLGVERHGTNKRRHHVTLPPHSARSPRTSTHASPPKVIVQAPTMPLGRHGGGGISKRRSSASLHDNVSIEYERSRRRGSWRQGRSLPGLKKYHVQYIGISGVKDRLKERRVEKRREKIRRSIGTRYYVEPVSPGSPSPS